MPIHESDQWRQQYFASTECPADVHIPTDDSMAYALNPLHRWIYDKLRVARSQGIECGPAAAAPLHYPVFSKPVTNLKGMGVGSRILRDARDHRTHCNAQDFWMTLLCGEHVSTDWAVVNGEATWCRHTLGIPGTAGTFDYWKVEAVSRPGVEKYSIDWIRQNLRDYTGMLNVETIGGQIIEAHLRFSDQWPDLYGRKWVDAAVRLYDQKIWKFPDTDRTDAYSVVLFGPHGRPYRLPSAAKLAHYRSIPGVSSLQITFSADVPPSAHAMPPGGFRLAIINCFDLNVGLRLRTTLAREFGLISVKPASSMAPRAAAGLRNRSNPTYRPMGPLAPMPERSNPAMSKDADRTSPDWRAIRSYG